VSNTGFENIDCWVGPWISDLSGRDVNGSEYRTLIDELQTAEEFPKTKNALALLNSDIAAAAEAMANWDLLVREKATLPVSVEEANKTILDKLAEIRAVAGLIRLGFTNIEFASTPDLVAARHTETAAIEVTRIGRSIGARSRVWEYQEGDLEADGYRLGLMASGGNVEQAISGAVYEEMSEKHRQLRDSQTDIRIVWISLGRDYYAAGAYESDGVSVFAGMSGTRAATVASTVQAIRDAEICKQLTHIVLCYGADGSDELISLRDSTHDAS
jgi:hypothetical protein